MRVAFLRCHNDRLKSPASRLLFTQPFIQAQIKENIKAPRNSPVTGEFPAQRASNAKNVSILCRHHDQLYNIAHSSKTGI